MKRPDNFQTDAGTAARNKKTFRIHHLLSSNCPSFIFKLLVSFKTLDSFSAQKIQNH
jgi:hypothetical protein